MSALIFLQQHVATQAWIAAGACASGTNGAYGCVPVFVPSTLTRCTATMNQTCFAAAEASEPDGFCTLPGDESGSSGEASGIMWGMIVSIVGDVIISIGLAWQKVAHNRIKKDQDAADAAENSNGGDGGDGGDGGEAGDGGDGGGCGSRRCVAMVSCANAMGAWC
uniref:Uncharacterized protein n=1 Tax=Chrysotila carterae TaxID=13221 RepID=A0A7S4BSR1_CHRCT